MGGTVARKRAGMKADSTFDPQEVGHVDAVERGVFGGRSFFVVDVGKGDFTDGIYVVSVSARDMNRELFEDHVVSARGDMVFPTARDGGLRNVRILIEEIHVLGFQVNDDARMEQGFAHGKKVIGAFGRSVFKRVCGRTCRGSVGASGKRPGHQEQERQNCSQRTGLFCARPAQKMKQKDTETHDRNGSLCGCFWGHGGTSAKEIGLADFTAFTDEIDDGLV